MRISTIMVAGVLLLMLFCVGGSLVSGDRVGMEELASVVGADNNCAKVNPDEIKGCVTIPPHFCPGNWVVRDNCSYEYIEGECSQVDKNLCQRGDGCCNHVELDCGTHTRRTTCKAIGCPGGFHCVDPDLPQFESCFEGEVKAQGC